MTIDQLPNSWQTKIQFTQLDDYLDECWVWTGAMNGPYGKVRDGRKTKQAHRAVYELLVGPVPDGLELDHLCFQRKCVNPQHLEAVTRQENMDRAWARRRGYEFTDEDFFDEEDLEDEVMGIALAKVAIDQGRLGLPGPQLAELYSVYVEQARELADKPRQGAA